MAKIYEPVKGYYLFSCPGCNTVHGVTASWSFNGDFEAPTFSPSVLVTGIPGQRCHSFITNGNIKYLDDCHHQLRSKTVELPEYNGYEG